MVFPWNLWETKTTRNTQRWTCQETRGIIISEFGEEEIAGTCQTEQNKNFVQFEGAENPLEAFQERFVRKSAEPDMADYLTEAPQILRDFLSYHENVKAHSKRTVDEYFLDLRNFFRYIKQIRDPDLAGRSLDEIDIMDVDLNLIASVTLTDI